jgi:hypothetical protein
VLPFSPKYDKTAYDDVVIFFPNNVLSKLPSSVTEIYYVVAIIDLENPDTLLASSQKVTIRIRRS